MTSNEASEYLSSEVMYYVNRLMLELEFLPFFVSNCITINSARVSRLTDTVGSDRLVIIHLKVTSVRRRVDVVCMRL